VLGRIRLRNSQHITGILYQSMLKSPSSAQKWPPLLAGKPDGLEHSSKTKVGTPRRRPYRIIRAQPRLRNLRRRQPLYNRLHSQRMPRQAHSFSCSLMRFERRIKVSHYAYFNHAEKCSMGPQLTSVSLSAIVLKY